MIITITAGPQEGKSGMAHWLAEQLKSRGASVVMHDNHTTEETAAQVRENYDKIVSFVASSKQPVHIITKLKDRRYEDKALVNHIVSEHP